MEKMVGMLGIMLKINTTFLPGSNAIDAILDFLSQIAVKLKKRRSKIELKYIDKIAAKKPKLLFRTAVPRHL